MTPKEPTTAFQAPNLLLDVASGSLPVRRLCVILAADIAGYSRLMEQNEEQTLAQLRTALEVLRDGAVQHGGRVFGPAGDGCMVEFPSAVEAVRAALAVQARMQTINAALPESRRMAFRIGLNLGDVLAEGDLIYGDGVNVAARIQALASPGGICIAENILDQIRNKIPIRVVSLGNQSVKNLRTPVRAYALDSGTSSGLTPIIRTFVSSRDRWKLAAAVPAAVLVALGAYASYRFLDDRRQPTMEASSPRIGVLPFHSLDTEQKDDLLANGLADDLTVDLERFRNVRVVAFGSTKSYSNTGKSLDEIGKLLNLDYIVEGSLRSRDDLYTLNMRLVRADDETVIWSDRWQLSDENLLKKHAELSSRIVKLVDEKTAGQPTEDMMSKDPVSMNVYRLQIEGRDYLDRHEPADNEKAKEILQRATTLTDKSTRGAAKAYADLSFVYVREWLYSWSADPEASRDKALELAREAYAIEPDNFESLWALGIAYVQFGEYEKAAEAYEAALKLVPQHAPLLAEYADTLVSMGQAERAVALVKQARDLDPHGPWWYEWNSGYGYYMLKDYNNAIDTLEGIAEPEDSMRLLLAMSYLMRGSDGDSNKASTNMEKFRAFWPEYDLAEADKQPFMKPQDKEQWTAGARLALALPR